MHNYNIIKLWRMLTYLHKINKWNVINSNSDLCIYIVIFLSNRVKHTGIEKYLFYDNMILPFIFLTWTCCVNFFFLKSVINLDFTKFEELIFIKLTL
jgi:hypothetical protein